MDIEKKHCPMCNQTLDASAFGVNKALPDGRAFYCKACLRVRHAAYYRASRERAGFTVREPDTSPDGFKRCSVCKEIKHVTEFHKQKTQADGLCSSCRVCKNARNSEKRLQREYGLTKEDIQRIVKSQNGWCAICTSNPPVHVDHDHATGKIRGVLCFQCNVALGNLRDDVGLFRKAIEYLEGTA